MEQYDFEQHLARLAEHIKIEPASMRELSKWYTALKAQHTHIELVHRLYKLPGWSCFNMQVLLDMANDVDAPFMRLMLRLSKDGYCYSVISMHRWWRRLKSINQQNLLGYLNYTMLTTDLSKVIPLTHERLLTSCVLTRQTLQSIHAMLLQDSSVDLTLRTRLDGISLKADVHKAWREWAKTHHPDKGGDVNTFILTKSCYEEWCAIYGDNK